jgi:HK97 gp10 family phage protein
MSIVVTGLEKLLRDMQQIDRQMNSRVVRPATRRALAPIKRRAKQNAKWKSIRRLISSKSFINKKGEVKGKVYLRPDKKRTVILQGREVGFEVVGNILEFGSAKKNIQPRPFMRPAADQGGAEAKAVLEREIKARLKKL